MRLWGERRIGVMPDIGRGTARCRRNHGTAILRCMNTLLLIIILLILFGGGGFYFGGPVIGGSGIGLILLILLIVYLAGGLRTKN